MAIATPSPARPTVRGPDPHTLPRLLAGPDAVSLAEHRRVYPEPKDDGLIARLEASGLGGRGGAGFPMATKLRAVASGRRRPVVVVNGAESEPASAKDRLLLTTRPHLVLDGAALAAEAVRARRVELCLDTDDAEHAVRMALAARDSAEPGGVPMHVSRVPRRYVSGEERALVRHLNGGPTLPPADPARPAERGVEGRPTLVNNVETLAHAVQIHTFGPTWFRSLGTEGSPGTRLVTVSGAVTRPAVYEVAGGTPIANVLRAAGGDPEGVQAVLLGGYFGTWITGADAWDLRLDDDLLRAKGAGMGSGVICFLPWAACGLVETARVAAWMARQTAGQCGPCVHGLSSIARGLTELARGGDPETETRVRRWAGDVEGRGACRLPDGTVRFVRSALGAFTDEIARHRDGGVCPGTAHPQVLPTPERHGG
jgi:NADH:ubiquinone oxidoreductase subunit F (NADH-binding)